jgi:hypothetical protein
MHHSAEAHSSTPPLSRATSATPSGTALGAELATALAPGVTETEVIGLGREELRSEMGTASATETARKWAESPTGIGKTMNSDGTADWRTLARRFDALQRLHRRAFSQQTSTVIAKER